MPNLPQRNSEQGSPDMAIELRKKSDAELLVLYDQVRLFANMVANKFKDTVGGDSYGWVGSMNDVDNLRSALDDLENELIERMPDEDEDDDNEF